MNTCEGELDTQVGGISLPLWIKPIVLTSFYFNISASSPSLWSSYLSSCFISVGMKCGGVFFGCVSMNNSIPVVTQITWVKLSHKEKTKVEHDFGKQTGRAVLGEWKSHKRWLGIEWSEHICTCKEVVKEQNNKKYQEEEYLFLKKAEPTTMITLL